jgi:UDP-glucuronate decarboxylase
MDLSSIKYNISNDVALAIQRSGADFSCLKGKKILLTGGTGFFGVWLLSSLLQVRETLGVELDIAVITRDPRSFLKHHTQFESRTGLSFLCGDITSIDLKGLKFSHLLHMATTSASETFSQEKQINKIELLYRGTRNLLSQLGRDLETVLFTSSGVVYGKPQSEQELLRETQFSRPDNLKPESALAYGKLLAEYLVSYFAEEFGYKYNIARCFSFLGQGLPLGIHYAAGNFIANAMRSEPIRVLGSGQESRSYMYIGDATAWLLRLLVEPTNDVYNVGSEKATKISELAHAVARQAGCEGRVEVLGGRLEEGNLPRSFYVPSTGKIRTRYPELSEWTLLPAAISKMMNSDCERTDNKI